MTDRKKFKPSLTAEEQSALHDKVSKDCLNFLVDNFVDHLDDPRKTPIVSSALMQIIIEFCLCLAPDKVVGFALLHQVLAQVSIRQIREDMVGRVSEYKELLTEEQKEKLESILGFSVDDINTPDDVLH
jgi:hypothetical protein